MRASAANRDDADVRAKANTICRDARTIGTALVTLAIVLGSIVALASQGATHPNATWVRLTAGIALLGAVFVGVGWIGERLTHRDPITEAHAEALRTSARSLLVSLAEGRECDYGIGHKPREAFHAHYPTPSLALDKWDSLLKAYIGHSGSLKERIWDEANEVANASEGRWSLDRSHIAVHITNSTQNRAKNEELNADFSLEEPCPHWATPMRDDDESADDWAARIERNIGRIEALGRTSQDWPEAALVAQSYRRLKDFKRDNRLKLIDALKLAEEDSATFEKECPTCKGTR